MHARMTLIGMENILNRTEDVSRSLKDAWELEGTTFDAETLLSTIMIKGGQMEPLFTDPRFYYSMTAQWWKKWYPTFSYWWIAAEKEYEPLWDRNGFEEVADHEDTTGTLDTATTGKEIMDDDTTGTKSSTEIMDDDTTYSKSGTGKEVTDDDTTYSKSAQSTSNTENKVSAFDANTYQPHDTSSTTTGSSESGSGTDDKTVTTTWSESGSGTDDKTTTFNEQTRGTDDRTTTTEGTVDTDTTGSKDFTHAMHSWGNWGISQTSQKLLDSEFDVRFRLNAYELMSDIFLNEMAVRVF